MASAFDPTDPQIRVGGYPVAGLIRRARRLAKMSQRQMARFAKVAPSTVGKVEAGAMMPSVDVLERLLGAAGLYLTVVDQDGRVVLPMDDWDDSVTARSGTIPLTWTRFSTHRLASGGATSMA